jgi:two-component system, NtrC family, C4-dicarboxylate transport response regulator DctD
MAEIKVILVEDDSDTRLGIEQSLELAGFKVDAHASAATALTAIEPGTPVVVLSDVKLRGMDGLELQQRLSGIEREVPVILMTGHGDIAMAVHAMRQGAYDFIEKPCPPERLVAAVQRAAEKRRLTLEIGALQQRLKDKIAIEGIIVGHSSAIEQVRQTVLALAATDADVLIVGETGVGKELVARCLHQFSARRNGPLVAVNSGGVPETLFESEVFGHERGAFTGARGRRIGKMEHAQGGTFFLDEIDNMPSALQVKLLRALQERTIERLGSNESIAIDCRVVAAAKDDLAALSRRGGFRADLYYRLDLADVVLPPLRERREDIPVLFEQFVLEAAMRYDRPAPMVSRPQIGALMEHSWPGNLRELHNAADRFVLGISEEPFESQADGEPGQQGLADQAARFERALIIAQLRRNKGNVLAASDALGVPAKTLYDKLRRLKISSDKSRP